MRCRTSTRFLLILSLLAMTVTLLGLAQPAVAQVDSANGPFQLEGDAVTQSSVCFRPYNPNTNTQPGLIIPVPNGGCPSGYSLVNFASTSDDWDKALGIVPGGHALASTGVVHDKNNDQSDTSFQGGGSKDVYGISSWLWKTAKASQAKDDISDSFAAAYQLQNGHTGIFFGLDRWDNSGDATAGFWFFQDSSVGLGDTPSGGGFTFTGHHTNNDLLIVSDFSTGGAVSSIAVYKWSCSGTGATCDSTGSLQLVTSLTNTATCDPTTGSSNLCSIVNPVSVPSPWAFSDKSVSNGANTANTFLHGEFLEGGIDLQAIFGNNIPCFTTFMAETRASTSPTATLSDFSGPHSFPLCGMSITKACGSASVNTAGTAVNYPVSGTVTNTGIGTLFDVTVYDTFGSGSEVAISVTNTTQASNYYQTQNLAPGDTGSWSKTFTSTSLSVPDSAIAKAATVDGGDLTVTSSNTATATCSLSVSSTLSITKTCDPGTSLEAKSGSVVVKVGFSGSVCNQGPSAITGLGLTDVPSATINLTSDNLGPKGSATECTTYTGSYYPSTISSGDGTVPGRYFFDDLMKITSATATLGTISTVSSPAACTGTYGCAGQSCPICPAGACPTQ